MVAKQTLTVNIRIGGARETLAAFRSLPAEASNSLRTRTLVLSQTLAAKIAAAGRSDSGQSALVAATVKAVRDRVPMITVGGPTRVGRHRAPASKIVFGTEFGSTTLKQFRPRRGSYWIFATVRKNESDIAVAWKQVVTDIQRHFGQKRTHTLAQATTDIFATPGSGRRKDVTWHGGGEPAWVKQLLEAAK